MLGISKGTYAGSWVVFIRDQRGPREFPRERLYSIGSERESFSLLAPLNNSIGLIALLPSVQRKHICGGSLQAKKPVDFVYIE